MDSQTNISQMNPMLGESSIYNNSITDNDIKELETSILKWKESRLLTEEEQKDFTGKNIYSKIWLLSFWYKVTNEENNTRF